mmetsp:Transcript_22031/g.34007  ORF Transcript_22031/g.34007 Transcript_22031/m.34007 type:complete len:256 (-) Transcript_22031:166-933(-)
MRLRIFVVVSLAELHFLMKPSDDNRIHQQLLLLNLLVLLNGNIKVLEKKWIVIKQLKQQFVLFYILILLKVYAVSAVVLPRRVPVHLYHLIPLFLVMIIQQWLLIDFKFIKPLFKLHFLMALFMLLNVNFLPALLNSMILLKKNTNKLLLNLAGLHNNGMPVSEKEKLLAQRISRMLFLSYLSRLVLNLVLFLIRLHLLYHLLRAVLLLKTLRPKNKELLLFSEPYITSFSTTHKKKKKHQLWSSYITYYNNFIG